MSLGDVYQYWDVVFVPIVLLVPQQLEGVLFPAWTFFWWPCLPLNVANTGWTEMGCRTQLGLSWASSIFPELLDDPVKVWGVGWVGPSMIGPMV